MIKCMCYFLNYLKKRFSLVSYIQMNTKSLFLSLPLNIGNVLILFNIFSDLSSFEQGLFSTDVAGWLLTFESFGKRSMVLCV